MLALLAGGAPIAHLALMKAACAEPARPAVRSSAAARDKITLPRSRPAAVGTQEAETGDDADAPALPEGFRELAGGSGEPQIPGLVDIGERCHAGQRNACEAASPLPCSSRHVA